MDTQRRVLSGFVGVWLAMSGAAVAWAEGEADVPETLEPAPADTGQATGTAPAVEATEAAEPAAETPQAAAPAPPSAEGLISVDFKDADIRQVLRIISLKSGVDIVAGTDVEGLVTIKLTNVPWEQALDIIVRTYGFAYERKGRIVRVMSKEALEEEPLATEVFALDYAKAKDVPGVIQDIMSDRGKIKFDERTNTVIVSDVPASLSQIREVIDRIDQRTPQVLVSSKVVETKLTKDDVLGIDWSNSLTLTQGTHTFANSTFPFPLESTFGELGQVFNWPSLREGTVTAGTVTLGSLTTSQLQTVLNFVKSRTDTHILSNPSIAILNNQKAKIHIGTEYPIPNYTIDPTTGNIQINGYETKDVGTLLEVTPHVNPSDEIVVDLKPEVIAVGSDVTYTTGSGGDIDLPQFTIQTAETSVRIKDGETIAIGGLIKTAENTVVSKVPLLADIPVLGALFRNTDYYTGSEPNRQDLLIFLTVDLMDQEPGEGEQTIPATPQPAAP